MTCLVVAGWRIVTLSSPSHVMTSNVVQPIQNISQLTSVWLCARRGCGCGCVHVVGVSVCGHMSAYVCTRPCEHVCVYVCVHICVWMCLRVIVCVCVLQYRRQNQRRKISELKKLFVDHKQSV